GPVPGDRDPRQPVEPGPVRWHDRPLVLLGPGDGRPAQPTGALPGELTAPADRLDPDPDAGDPWRAGLPGAHHRGPAAVVGPGAVRGAGEVPVLPRREPLDPHPGERDHLVPDGARVPGRARARREMGAPGVALTRPPSL